MKKKYFGEEYVFEFIWHGADKDGIWNGDDVTIAKEFTVAEDEAYAALSELCDRNLLQRLGTATYIITRWPERDVSAEEKPN